MLPPPCPAQGTTRLGLCDLFSRARFFSTGRLRDCARRVREGKFVRVGSARARLEGRGTSTFHPSSRAPRADAPPMAIPRVPAPHGRHCVLPAAGRAVPPASAWTRRTALAWRSSPPARSRIKAATASRGRRAPSARPLRHGGRDSNPPPKNQTDPRDTRRRVTTPRRSRPLMRSADQEPPRPASSPSRRDAAALNGGSPKRLTTCARRCPSRMASMLAVIAVMASIALVPKLS